MNLYQPTITGSLSVSGSVNISGSITIANGGTISGTASIATTALTASSADNFLVRNTLTAQTLVVQTITSSVDFVTGSTRFGSTIGNTHVFTGSMSVSGSITSQGGFILGNSATIAPTGSIGYNNAVGVFIYGKSGSEADFRIYNRDGLTAMSVTAGTQNVSFNGSVAIGTSNTTARLNVQASSNFETSTLGIATGTMGYLSANGLYGMYVGIGNSGNTWLQSQRNDGSTTAYNLLLNPQGGNVGIGLTNPQTQFHMNGVLTLTEAGYDTARKHTISHGHSDGSSPNNYIAFSISDGSGTTAERMRINGVGNLAVAGAVYRYSGQTLVGGSFTTLVNADFGSSRTYLIQMVAVNSEASTNYRWFGVLQYNYNSNTFAVSSLASQTMEVTMSGGNIQARTTNGQQYTFNWSITQLL
jgi:hypothetical protein